MGLPLIFPISYGNADYKLFVISNLSTDIFLVKSSCPTGIKSKLLYEKHPDVKIYAAKYIPGGLNKDGYIVTAAGDAGYRICGTCSYKPARPAKP